MRTDAQCIFCKIVAGTIPSTRVYDDERCIAFRDLHPEAPTHILIVPREHIARLDAATDADAPLLGHLMRVAATIAKQEGLEDFRLVANAGASAGQSVFHLHFHLLGGRSFNWPPG